jgi:hypothetical protein
MRLPPGKAALWLFVCCAPFAPAQVPLCQPRPTSPEGVEHGPTHGSGEPRGAEAQVPGQSGSAQLLRDHRWYRRTLAALASLGQGPTPCPCRNQQPEALPAPHWHASVSHRKSPARNLVVRVTPFFCGDRHAQPGLSR